MYPRFSAEEPYYGATIGRYGNRIANGKFTLDGQVYTLNVNNGSNTLHGGGDSFEARVWDASQTDISTLMLSYFSKDGEGGFPGTLDVKVVYTLTDNNELKIYYTATTDKKTIVNLTNHAFFNLNGEGSNSITDHILMLDASMYTPINNTLIPLGKIESVINTPLDFNTPTEIGKRINDKNEQIDHGLGYDHNFVLNRKGADVSLAGTVLGPKTSIIMEIFTEEPGVQFYSGNFLNGKDKGKSEKYYEYRTAFCLETQHFPDSPNQPEFPSTELNPGEIYKTSSVYKFSVKK